MKKEYKFGIRKYRRINSINTQIAICSCGTSARYQNGYQCQNCANDYFVSVGSMYNEKIQPRFVIPYLEAERRDNRGFKIKRTNLSVLWENEMISPIKENLTRTIDYDIVDRRLVVWRADCKEFDSTDPNLSSNYKLEYSNKMFFTQLNPSSFIEFASNDTTRDMFEFANRVLSDCGWNKKDNVLKGLYSLYATHSWMQILSNAGIANVSRFAENYRRYGATRADTIIATDKTKPHEILKVPKFMITYIREDLSIDRSVLSSMQGHIKNLDVNKLRDALEIIKDESTMRDFANSIDNLSQLHKDYGYDNFRKLVLYIFRECRLTQGIDRGSEAVNLLRDYVRMSKSLNLDYEKYPKSLKKEHDVVLMNYKLINDNSDKQARFKLAIDMKSYQELIFEDKKADYKIIAPNEYQDLVKEGNQLSHCVSSYVKDVSNEKCKIFFLRHKENIDIPLATIEVRGYNIRQARGFANRAVREEERQFIKQWAEEKGLVEAYY